MNVNAEFTVSTEEGRALISATASLVKRADQWVKGIPDAKEEDALGCTGKKLPPERSQLHCLAIHEKSL